MSVPGLSIPRRALSNFLLELELDGKKVRRTAGMTCNEFTLTVSQRDLGVFSLTFVVEGFELDREAKVVVNDYAGTRVAMRCTKR
jgi:hypothetical protein